jgi:hypothetical protein
MEKTLSPLQPLLANLFKVFKIIFDLSRKRMGFLALSGWGVRKEAIPAFAPDYPTVHRAPSPTVGQIG